ncbi:hypothetical protein DFR70_102166 [Nocardia tenerifensis]|uniref:Uncharacterized protein n=1 Tax=Nocardia tenerifensis TaxID=228006 RepID=A0A318K623_9NOCA|nr:DUF6350 family protein [Nocardia tenerifensis]PXX68485.1 hypothetical protein DFR70_102166 [Nocardia tenerifensis]
MSSTRNSLPRRTGGSRRVPEPHAETDEAGFLSLTPERARVLVLVAGRPTTYALTAIIVLALATLLTSGSNLAGTSGAIAAGWLGVHQVPLVIGKTTLGLLPLLPTALVVWLAGRECARAVEPDYTRADLGWIVGAALAGPLLITAICLAVAEDASGVVALQPPNTLAAFGWVGGLYLVAAAGGIATRTRRELFATLRLPDWAISGMYGAGRAVLRLLGCAAVLVVFSFLMHLSRVGDTYRGAGNAAGVIGLTLLSLAYLPNLVVQAVGVLVGAGAQFGDASFGLFSVVGGPIPAVPLMAAVPTGPAAGWWPVLLLVPAAIGVLGGIDLARGSTDRIGAPWATLCSAGLATVALLLLGVVAGGELGTFGRFGPDFPVFVVVTFAWLAVPGYAGLAFARWFLFPVGAVPANTDDPYAEDYYADDDHADGYYADDDHADDYYADDDHADDYYADDDYADDDYGRRGYYEDDYAGPDHDEALDGELVEEQTSLSTVRTPGANTTPDIVDAEVVEADLPESGRVDGR